MRVDCEDAGMSDKKEKSGFFVAMIGVLAGAILTGAVGYVFGVVNDNRKSELEFVNAQIEKLYGPLYAMTQAGNANWKFFNEHHWKRSSRGQQDSSVGYFDDSNPPTTEEVKTWRRWVNNVWQPLNLKMEATIVENSQLIIGDTMPAIFRDLIAHINAYKPVIVDWKDEDFDGCPSAAQAASDIKSCPALSAAKNTALMNFPTEIVECILDDYNNLKRKQEELKSAFFWAPGTAVIAEACP